MSTDFRELLNSVKLDKAKCESIIRKASINSALVSVYTTKEEFKTDKTIVEIIDQLGNYNLLFNEGQTIDIREVTLFIRANKELLAMLVEEGEAILLEASNEVKQPQFFGKTGSGKETTMRCLVTSLDNKGQVESKEIINLNMSITTSDGHTFVIESLK